MKKILEYCYLNDCVLSVSFEIPMQVTLGVRNWRLGKLKQQMLPWTTQLDDEKMFDCIKWMIDKILEEKDNQTMVSKYGGIVATPDTYKLPSEMNLTEYKNLQLTEHEQKLLLGWYTVVENETRTDDDEDNLQIKIKELYQ